MKPRQNRQKDDGNEKDKIAQTIATIIEAKRGPYTLMVSMFPDGRIVIEDHSDNDDGKELIQRLQKNGVNVEITYEGLCG